jgi:hypothetical protein
MHPTKLIHVDDAVLAQIQALEKEAASTVTQSNTKFLIGGVAVFALLVAPLGLPAAAMVAAPLVLIAIKRAVKSGSAAAYMKESGNFAPLLSDRQLLKLTSLVGKQTVIDQLKEALEDGKYLSGSALDYLEHCGISTTPPDLKAELAAYDKRQQEEANTVTVTAETVEDKPAVEANLLDDGAMPVGESADSSDIAPVNLIEAIAADPKSLFLSAPVRTGKGVLIAGAIRATQKLVTSGKHPSIKSIKFWVMTPKQFPGEYWYWQTVDQFHNPDLDAGNKQAVVRSIYQFIVEFTALQRDRENPTVLVIDEFSRLLGLVAGVKMCDIDPVVFSGDTQGFDRWLIDKVMLSASMMQANGFYAWVILPANTVGGRGFSKGDADSFNVFTLASPANLAFADGSGAAFAAPAIAANHPVFKQGFAAGYRKRDRKWYPVPNFGDIVDRRTDKEPPVELANRWLAPIPQVETASLLADQPVATVEPKAEPAKPLSDYFELFRYRPLLIWGPQGSGKSTIARQLVRLKRQQGQTVFVVNPHGSPVEWDGAEVVGQGRDYMKINGFLKTYLGEITERYKTFADSGLTEQQFLEQLVTQNKVLSPICEEMSGWFHNLDKDLLGAFSLAALSESRKVAMAPVFIAHDRALDFVGLKRGANLRDSGLVELELLAPDHHPETGLLCSSGRGILRIPGGAAFNVHFDNFDAANEPIPTANPADLSAVFSLPAEATEPTESPAIDENAAMVAEYRSLYAECSTCSAVLDKLGTKLERRGLIEKRTVDCLKSWLTENNLPLPSKSAAPSEAETEPDPAQNPPPKRKVAA